MKSLTLKISLLATAILSVSIIALSTLTIENAKKQEREDLSREAIAFAKYSALPIYRQNYVQFYTHPGDENFQEFTNRLNSHMQDNEDVSNISLISINGTILFDSDETKTFKYTGSPRTVHDPELITMVESASISHRETIQNGKRTLEVVVPIIEGSGSHLFSLKYSFLYTHLNTRINAIYITTLTLSIPLLVISIVLAWIFSRTLTKPLSELAVSAQQISEGKLDTQIAIKSKDEIGTLAQAFQDMTIKLKGYYQELENKVKERTQALESKNKELEQINKYMTGRELKMKEMKTELERLKQVPAPNETQKTTPTQ